MSGATRPATPESSEDVVFNEFFSSFPTDNRVSVQPGALYPWSAHFFEVFFFVSDPRFASRSQCYYNFE